MCIGIARRIKSLIEQYLKAGNYESAYEHLELEQLPMFRNALDVAKLKIYFSNIPEEKTELWIDAESVFEKIIRLAERAEQQGWNLTGNSHK